MVKTTRQTIINEKKIRISPKEAKELVLLHNGVEVDAGTSFDEDVRLPGFTRFGDDEFGIDDIQSE